MSIVARPTSFGEMIKAALRVIVPMFAPKTEGFLPFVYLAVDSIAAKIQTNEQADKVFAVVASFMKQYEDIYDKEGEDIKLSVIQAIAYKMTTELNEVFPMEGV